MPWLTWSVGSPCCSKLTAPHNTPRGRSSGAPDLISQRVKLPPGELNLTLHPLQPDMHNLQLNKLASDELSLPNELASDELTLPLLQQDELSLQLKLA